MANEAYRLKADTSIPQPIRQIDELHDGSPIFETAGRTYNAGDYVLASEMTPDVRERAENGELDHLLEPASADDARAARQVAGRVFIPEHEAEAVVLEDAGHRIVPRDQVIELKGAGLEAAREALEQAKEEGRDERPALTAREHPNLADVSRGEADPAGESDDEQRVSDEELRGVEQPPGFPVGQDLAAAEGDEEALAAAREATKERRVVRRGQQRAAKEQEVEEGRQKQQKSQQKSQKDDNK